MKRASFAVRAVIAIAETACRFPIAVLVAAGVLFVAMLAYARGVEVRSDLAELLPRDSPAFRAYEHQAGRTGGASSLIVIVSSPDRNANERFVDELGSRFERLSKTRPDLVGYVEANAADVERFYEANKWLFADIADLERIDGDLDHQIAIRSGLVSDLFADEAPAATSDTGSSTAVDAGTQKSALGLGDALDTWKKRKGAAGELPNGYFSAREGTLLGLRVVTDAALASTTGDELLVEARSIIDELRKSENYSSSIQVGFTGDVAGAAEEKSALLSEAAWATVAAVALILAAIAFYFRSGWAIAIVGAPVAIGVVAAYAFARATFGYVNTAGAFLGAIIVGNGINYPIVLLARYRDFVARGVEPSRARVDAVVNALRAELAGALVASIAYGSLVVTRFRGFRQFGAIGFVGMLLVWAAIVPLVPAALALGERIARWRKRRPSPEPFRPLVLAAITHLTTKRPRVVLFVALVAAIASASLVPTYLRDPWEYDFGKLGSRSSDVRGSGDWSNKANEVFGGKANIAGASIVADSPAQVPLIERAILENDARDPKGRMIAEVTTIDDALPGSLSEQHAKLDVLARIRSRLTPRVLAELDPEERKTVEEARPPESLRELHADDLPAFVRRRFTERNGTVGSVFYVKPQNDIVFADGHNHLRLSATTDNVHLPDGTTVMTASRSTVFAEMIASLRRDGPLASAFSLGAVIVVVLVLSRDRRVATSILVALVFGLVLLLGGASLMKVRLNYVNFIALPITIGIGCEYPFNLADRVRLLEGDVAQAILRSGGPVLLCSFTTIVGYGSLLLSDFQALESFGKLAVLGEAACVLAAVLVVPALLTCLAKVRGRASAS